MRDPPAGDGGGTEFADGVAAAVAGGFDLVLTAFGPEDGAATVLAHIGAGREG